MRLLGSLESFQRTRTKSSKKCSTKMGPRRNNRKYMRNQATQLYLERSTTKLDLTRQTLSKKWKKVIA